MSDWPPMKPVKHQHEKESTYLKLVDMFVDVVEPAIIQMVLQNRNWDLEAALEDIIILASTSHVDKSRNLNKSESGFNKIKLPCTDIEKEEMSNNDFCQEKNLPLNVAKPLFERNGLNERMSLNLSKKNMKKSKPQLSGSKPGLKHTADTKTNNQPNNLLPFIEQYNYVKSIPILYDRTVMLIRDGVKLMVILRGPPGSGKSHLARKLLNDAGIALSDHKRHTFSSDNFFVQNNTYLFVPDLLSQAHMWNQRNVAAALREEISPILVDNTNTQAWEMRAYVEMAVSAGYDIEILEPETWWFFKERELAKKNIHGVPKAKIRNMIERYEKGITPELLLKNFDLMYSLSNAPPQQVRKSKWKDKLNSQNNNKPKKKKSDFIPKNNSFKNFSNDNLPSTFSFDSFPGQAPNLQYPFCYSENELKRNYDSTYQKNGEIVALDNSEPTSKGLINRMNDQQFKPHIESKLAKNCPDPIDNSELLSTFSQYSNPFLPNAKVLSSKEKEQYFNKSPQTRYIQKGGSEHSKDNKDIKNTFDFMVETKKLLAALGNHHSSKNEKLESLFQEKSITLPELPKLDKVTSYFCEETNTPQNNSRSEVAACTESNEWLCLKPRQNESLDEIKSIANDLIIQKAAEESKENQNSSSTYRRDEVLWEYVLVNDDCTFTYKRLNPDPITSHVFNVEGKSCEKSAVTVNTASIGQSLNLTNQNAYTYNGNDSKSIDLSVDKVPDSTDSCEHSEYYQKRVSENDDLLKNCSARTEENVIFNMSAIEPCDSRGNTHQENDKSEGDKSLEDVALCNASTDSKEIVTLENVIDNTIYFSKHNSIIESNETFRNSDIFDESNNGSLTKEFLRNGLDGANGQDTTRQNHISLDTLIHSKEIQDNTDKTCEIFMGKLDDSKIYQDDISNISNYVVQVKESNCDTTCVQIKTPASEENIRSDDIFKIIDKEGFDRNGVLFNENLDERFKICEKKSPDSPVIENVNINLEDGKHDDKSNNEERTVVLEMMANILKSMAPLCENPTLLLRKNDAQHTNYSEKKELQSNENCVNIVSSTLSASDMENETSWVPQNKQTTQTEMTQPKPARNKPRTRVQQFFEESSLAEPQELPSSLISWDTVSNPAEHWNELNNVLCAPKESPVALPQRIKLSNNKLTDSSTNTNYQDFSLVKNDCSPGIKVLFANSRSITDGCYEFKSDVSETLSLHKSTMTSGLVDALKSYDIAHICTLFPHIPKSYILDMVDKCHGDINWAVDILLDSEHSIYEMSEENCDKETAEEMVSSSKDNTELVNGVFDDETHFISEDDEVKNVLKISNMQEQSRIKRMLENSIVIGKSHYSEKVLKVLKKTRPEYLSMVESSQCQTEQKFEKDSSSINNLCETDTTIVDMDVNEVGTGSSDTEDDDDNFEVVVNNDLILQLQQKFGNPNFPKLTNMMPLVKLPVSLARQLYGYIMDSLQADIDEQQDAIEQMISQDEEVARLIQSHDDNLKPQLQEIIDMEVALEFHRADQAEMKEKHKSTVAAKLSKNILLEKFPHVDPKMLMEVFHAHNYSLHDTVASLSLALGVEGAHPKPLPSTSKQDQMKEMEGGFAEEMDLSQDAQAYRDQAASYYSLRIECLSKAQEAFRSNNKLVASYYSQLAQMHKDKVAHYNSQAAACLMSSHKKGNNSLDLHFLHVTEAQVVLNMFLDETITNINEKKKTHQTVYLITGRGLRSVGGISRIKPMVVKTLGNRGILFNEVNPGMISAFVRSTTPLSNSL